MWVGVGGKEVVREVEETVDGNLGGKGFAGLVVDTEGDKTVRIMENVDQRPITLNDKGIIGNIRNYLLVR